jgi:hypothetical protein
LTRFGRGEDPVVGELSRRDACFYVGMGRVFMTENRRAGLWRPNVEPLGAAAGSEIGTLRIAAQDMARN